MWRIILTSLILMVSTGLSLFTGGCSTEQLQQTQAMTHSIAYPADVNVVVFDPNDPNSAAVMQITENIEKILVDKHPVVDALINTMLPIAGTYGGWAGFAAMVAAAIYNRKKK
jgi:hypothetical protein